MTDQVTQMLSTAAILSNEIQIKINAIKSKITILDWSISSTLGLLSLRHNTDPLTRITRAEELVRLVKQRASLLYQLDTLLDHNHT